LRPQERNTHAQDRNRPQNHYNPLRISAQTTQSFLALLWSGMLG
jgi:hypothetical protein